MSEPAASETLVIERTFDAPATAVFDAFTDEEVMRRWWHARRDWTTSEASVDLRVGGAVRVVMRDLDGDPHGGGGNYTEVDRPHRVAFTWTWDRGERETLIEIDFRESNGATAVTFTHSNLDDVESARDHEDGWNRCFDNLDRALAEA
ncbi:MAG TPA: SRPBCC domain-containing protein [Solirubrobacterales bacterium]|nr:SRPBCC domain-containing protein [Solirubrobacterales bacterium]